MAMTLVEAAKLSNDRLLVGVIEETIHDSPILQNLPFINITGNGLTFNRENELPTAHFRDVGDTITESTPTFNQITATLKQIIDDADVDNFLKATRSDLQDLEAEVIKLKSKATKNLFEQKFLYGDSSSNSREFDGLRKFIDLTTSAGIENRQVVQAGIAAAGNALSLIKLDELIDKVKGGKPDALIMSKRSRRLIQEITRDAGFNLETSKDAFGNFLTIYNGVPFWLTDWQLDTHATLERDSDDVLYESSTTSGDESVIYAVRLGEGALAGLQSPEGFQVEPVGSLETKNATRTRILWYVSLALFCSVSVAALIGFDAS